MPPPSFVLPVLTEDALCPIINVINEDVKQCWLHYPSQEGTIGDWPPAELCAADRKPLEPHSSATFQSTFLWYNCIFIILTMRMLWETN